MSNSLSARGTSFESHMCPFPIIDVAESPAGNELTIRQTVPEIAKVVHMDFPFLARLFASPIILTCVKIDEATRETHLGRCFLFDGQK